MPIRPSTASAAAAVVVAAAASSVSALLLLLLAPSSYAFAPSPRGAAIRFRSAPLRASDEDGGGGAPFFASYAATEEKKGGESTDGATAAPADAERSDPMTFREEVSADASDALSAVGWSSPLTSDELTSDDPFVRRIDDTIRSESGVGLDELLNPAKVVNLERDLYNLRSELAYITGKGRVDVADLTTDECDGGGGGSEADVVRSSIAKKERDLLIERRAVFRGWLKNVFLGQAALSLALSWVMVSDPASLFGRFDWFGAYSMDVSIRVLGFWWWWLFIVPSLRSRRPRGAEKRALDLAFLATPLVSVLAPAVTRDTEVIWLANLAVVGGCYAFAILTDEGDGDEDDDADGPEWLKFVYKSLDFGSGRERGARK